MWSCQRPSVYPSTAGRNVSCFTRRRAGIKKFIQSRGRSAPLGAETQWDILALIGDWLATEEAFHARDPTRSADLLRFIPGRYRGGCRGELVRKLRDRTQRDRLQLHLIRAMPGHLVRAQRILSAESIPRHEFRARRNLGLGARRARASGP